MGKRTPQIVLRLRALGVIPKRREGLQGTRPPMRWKGEELAALKAACERDDLTIAEIAQQFKTGRGQVRALIKLHGWVRPVNGMVINGKRLSQNPKREEWKKIPRTGRPKGIKMSAETRAKHSETMRRRWSGPEREKLLAIAARGRKRCHEMHPDFNKRTLPPKGTPARRLFNKLAGALGAKTAHEVFAQVAI